MARPQPDIIELLSLPYLQKQRLLLERFDLAKLKYLLFSFGLALLLGLLNALIVRQAELAVWHLGTNITAFLLLFIVRISSPTIKKLLCWIFPIYALTLSFLTILSYFSIIPNSGQTFRASVVFGNSNLLGASLVFATLVTTLLIKSKLLHFVLFPIMLIALLLTGSRTAVVSLIIIVFCYVYLLRKDLNLLRIAIVLMTVTIALTGVTAIYQSQTQKTKNILIASNALNHPAWVKNRAEQIDIKQSDILDPIQSKNANHIKAISETGKSPALVLYQGAGISKSGQAFVSSIYLRADEDMQILLSSNLSRVRCFVGQDWQRCITPVAYGNGSSEMQLKLMTSDPQQKLDFYAWGAQLELGEEVTDVAISSKYSLPPVLLNRFRLTGFSDESFLPARIASMRAAWDIFLKHPISGVGLGQWPKYYEDTVYAQAFPHLKHTHNLFLHMLAETGILGLLAMLIPLLYVAFVSWTQLRYPILAFGIFLLITNSTDVIYFNSGIYYFFWLATGLVLFRSQVSRESGSN